MRKYTLNRLGSSIFSVSMGLVVAMNFASALLAAAPSAQAQCLHKILAADGEAQDRFGRSVAISGTTTIVGAYGDDDNGRSSGSAYLFDATTGQQIAKLLPDDGAESDLFGGSVGIRGTTAIIGAHGDDDNGTDSGSAYLFNTTTGQQIAKLLPDDGAEGEWFGSSVGISGTTAIVGAQWDGDNGFRSGSAYLFDISDPANPTQIAKLLPSDGAEGDYFGNSVAISGTTAIVGADRDGDNGPNSGSAYLFDTTTGRQIAKLLPNDGAEGDRFAISVAISGATAIAGASGDDDNGSAYLFDTTTGRQIGKLLASDGTTGGSFGHSVAISGATAIIGADRDATNGNDSGSAYLFDVNTGSQIAKILTDDGALADLFGGSVAISGFTAIVGATGEDENGYDSGSAYVLDVIRCSPSRLVVAPDPLVAGEVGTFAVTTALPNERTWLLYSLRGLGVTFISALNVVVNLDNPQLAAGPRLSDANGDVEWTGTMPAVRQPIDVWFQVVQMQNVTNVAAMRIVP